MTHLVLARKYRPKNFAQVLGQDLIVATLKSAIEKGRIAHAMLFTGGRGIGKTTIARIVAKAVVCEARKSAEPCGSCSQCVSIDNFSSLDVVEIDGASHTGVDDIRSLRDSARYQPTSAKKKIFIIDEVHMLSISAFNALLKILEEPPAHVMFIFATTEVHKIPKTILSRCQRYDFKRVSSETIFAALKSVCQAEGHTVDDDGLRLIASLADGALRDGLSMAEQVVSRDLEHHTAESVAQVLGVVSHKAVHDICLSVLQGEVAPALLIVKEVYEKGLDLCQLMDAMAERFRILSLCAHVDKNKACQLIPSLSEEDFCQASQFDSGDLKRLFAMAIEGAAQVFSASRPLLALELFVLRAATRPPLQDAVTINYYLQKLDAIMHNRPQPAHPLQSSMASEKKKPQRSERDEKVSQPAKDTVKKSATVVDCVEQFGCVIEKLGSSAAALASHLRHARPSIDASKNALHLLFEQTLHYEQVSAHNTDQKLRAVITEVFGRELELCLTLDRNTTEIQKKILTVAESDEVKTQKEKEALFDRARNNSLVKTALEIFGGDITEVQKVSALESK